jgi:alkanesulfonate monooxygenase SsuD/methylene tetrahydromethanopterin reductase-like flavin-dependent oxidoreductase (luciferase family)
MRFGIFYELQRPRPWEPDGDEKLIREALEQIELADQLGFDYVWASGSHRFAKPLVSYPHLEYLGIAHR